MHRDDEVTQLGERAGHGITRGRGDMLGHAHCSVGCHRSSPQQAPAVAPLAQTCHLDTDRGEHVDLNLRSTVCHVATAFEAT